MLSWPSFSRITSKPAGDGTLGNVSTWKVGSRSQSSLTVPIPMSKLFTTYLPFNGILGWAWRGLACWYCQSQAFALSTPVTGPQRWPREKVICPKTNAPSLILRTHMVERKCSLKKPPLTFKLSTNILKS